MVAAPVDWVAAWLSAVALVVREAQAPADQAVALVVQEDPVDPAADREAQEGLVGFPVVQAGRGDPEEEAAGVLQAVEQLTPRKSLK